MKKCKIEGCDSNVWSGDTCRRHTSYKPLKKAPTALRKQYKPKDEESINLMREFFMSIWRKRRHVSELSGECLSPPPSSAYFHHILYKEKYKEAMYDEENIILVTMDEHANIHSNPERYEKINEKSLYLKNKYNIFD